MATTAQRLKEALRIRDMKQADLSEKTGIGKSSISTYISGSYEPKQKNLYKLAMALNVNEAWLMGLDVPMERKSHSSSKEAFISYIESLGYYLYRDDPEHKPFLCYDDSNVLLQYHTLDKLKQSIDSYTKATLDAEMLALKEKEIQQKRIEKERIIRHLRGEGISEDSQFKKDWYAIAANNEHIEDPGELEKTLEDAKGLKRPE